MIPLLCVLAVCSTVVCVTVLVLKEVRFAQNRKAALENSELAESLSSALSKMSERLAKLEQSRAVHSIAGVK